MFFDWSKRRHYRDATIDILVVLCPGTIAAAGGRHVRDLFAKTMYSLHRPIFDAGFAQAKTPEQTALAIAGALISKRISEMPTDQKNQIGSELRGKVEEPTHSTARQILFVIDTAIAWEGIAKIKRPDIDSFVEVALQNVP